MAVTSNKLTISIPGKIAVIPPNISCDKNQNVNIELILGLICHETKDCSYFTYFNLGLKGPSWAYKKCILKSAIAEGLSDFVGAISGDKNCNGQPRDEGKKLSVPKEQSK